MGTGRLAREGVVLYYHTTSEGQDIPGVSVTRGPGRLVGDYGHRGNSDVEEGGEPVWRGESECPPRSGSVDPRSE